MTTRSQNALNASRHGEQLFVMPLWGNKLKPDRHPARIKPDRQRNRAQAEIVRRAGVSEGAHILWAVGFQRLNIVNDRRRNGNGRTDHYLAFCKSLGRAVAEFSQETVSV